MALKKTSGKKKSIDYLKQYQELKKAEEALRESEENFRVLFDENPLPTVMSEMTSKKIAFVNKRMAAVLGMDPKDIIGKTVNDLGLLKNPGDQEKLTKLIAGKGYVDSVEIDKTLPDETLGADLVSMRLVSINGKRYCLTVIQDITERKQAEEALCRSQERYRLLHEYAPVGILLVNRSGNVLEVNSAALQILGSPSPEATKGINLLTFPLLIEAGVSEAFRRCVETGQVVFGEYPYTSNWGKSVHTQLRFVPIFDHHDQVNLVHTIIEDITERKRAEEELRNSKETLELIFKISPDAAVLTRLNDGSIVDINERFVTISGFTRSEVIGKTTIELNLYENTDIRQKVAEGLGKNGYCENIETVFRTKSGKKIIGIMSSQVIPLHGAPHVYSIIRDITEFKKTESLLMNAQKLESLGVLAGGIAHDFNNLLTGIFGNVDLARSVSKDAQAKEYLEAAIAAMGRARALTLQLLTFAKGGSPIQKITPLVPFIQEVVHFGLSGSNISCRFSLSENLWPCNIDKNQIGQVIDNIVINAQQAMPGGGAIEITAENISLGEKKHPSLAEGDYVKVSIKDFGIGIPKDIMPRIFDPFYTTKTKGHGLGLATCYSIVNRHGGFIDVESEPGKGSTFHFYLPASPQALIANAAAIIKHRGSGTIIFVDDEEILRITVRKMLESLGYAAVCKNDGQEAIDFFINETKARRRCAAMIFDLTIPGAMGGKEAIAEIRKLDKDIPVFVASGYADNSVMIQPAEYGFTASICKPFTIEELSEMLHKHLPVSS